MTEQQTMTIRLIDGEKEAELFIDNPSDKAKESAVSNLFHFFGAGILETVTSEVKLVSELGNAPLIQPIPLDSALFAPLKEVPVAKQTIKHVPNDTRVVNEPTTMEEALSTNSHYETGYKVRNGFNHYKCYYRCTKCEHKGQHYIPQGVEQVDCHKCQTSLMVKKAVPGEGFKADKWKNWFVAGAQTPFIQIKKMY